MPSFEAYTATLAGNPVRGSGALLNLQTGQRPARGILHMDLALGTDQDGPVAVRRAGPRGLPGCLEEVFRVCPKSSHAELIGRPSWNVRRGYVYQGMGSWLRICCT
jgi:hypothetical protein